MLRLHQGTVLPQKGALVFMRLVFAAGALLCFLLQRIQQITICAYTVIGLLQQNITLARLPF